MKHQHRPILRIMIMVLLGGLAIAGGPIAFVLLVMIAPLFVVLVLSTWAILNGGAASDVGHQRRAAPRATQSKPWRTQ